MSRDPKTPKPTGLWARLFGLGQPETAADQETPAADIVPDWDVAGREAAAPPAPDSPASVPAALPVASPAPAPLPGIPSADRESTPLARPVSPQKAAPIAVAEALPLMELEIGPPVLEAPPVPPQLCPSCQTPRKGKQAYCDDCGWMFPPGDAAPAVRLAGSTTNTNSAKTAGPAMPAKRIKDRYQVNEKTSERCGISRYRGLDLSNPASPQPVVIVEAALPEMAEPIADDLPVAAIDERADEEILPTFEDAPLPVASLPQAVSAWPSIAWEKDLLDKANHPVLPAAIDYFVENNAEYLIEGGFAGRSLWDAWDDADAGAEVRYGWLKQLAEGLQALHKAGAIIEGLRPDLVNVTAAGQVMLADLSDLLPLPLPPDAPLRGTLYTAPELILSPQQADARSDLYSFGALIYALEYLHHALEEKDFEHQFSPKQITDRYPDVHPLFFRLVSKTFVRDPNTRFPTDEAGKIDPTGFTELLSTLEVCRRTFDRVRLDIAAWTTTGMVRTGNEDAFGFMQAVESRQDDLHEYALLLLADGMGGYEAGEVAAALAISKMRENLLAQPMFSSLAGKEPPQTAFDVQACKLVLQGALKFANREVYTASRVPGKGRRGMGCTAEAVYLDSRNVVVGHVGDSRTYHLHEGRLIQLTRDQTLVNRLVELGQLTAEEAENHPRKVGSPGTELEFAL